MTWERLQAIVTQAQNRRVREYFKDLDDNPIPNQSRAVLRDACLIDDVDTATITLIKLFFYYIVLEGGETLSPPLYTIPVDRYQQEVRFLPQITLYFREDIDDVEEGFKPIDAELSFRVRAERYNTLTPANAQILAQKVAAEFSISAGYRWQKGRVKLAYRDKEKGYQFSVNAFSESQGRELISKVLDIQNDLLDPAHLTITEMGSPPPILPPTELVYGKARRLPRRRPVGWVRFRYAELHLWGVNKPITLVDRTLRRRDALIQA